MCKILIPYYAYINIFFIFKINEKTYLVDSIKKELVEVKKEKMDKKIFIFNPSENMYLYYGG